MSGRRVKGLPAAERRDATTGSTLEAVAASWTIGNEEWDRLHHAAVTFELR
jgi:hypothetical protein